jgi:DNA-3-methyladenine glycosylase II
VTELVYVPRGPFSLARTSARFTRLPDPVSRVVDGGFARLVPAGRGLALVRIAQEGPASRARLRVRIHGPGAASEAARDAALRVVERVLGASADLRPFVAAHARDALLGPALAAHRGLRVAGAFDLFESLVNAVLTQQVNLQFAYSIRAELVRAYGRSARIDGERWLAFPAPAAIAAASEAELRGFRLSAAKAATLRRIAQACVEGALAEEPLAALSDEAAIDALVRWKGIGRWTAEVALIRGLGRLDVFPAGDLAVLKRLAPAWLGRDASEAKVRAFAARWHPFRSLALVYAFRGRSPAGSGARARCRRSDRPSPTPRPCASPGGAAARSARASTAGPTRAATRCRRSPSPRRSRCCRRGSWRWDRS